MARDRAAPVRNVRKEHRDQPVATTAHDLAQLTAAVAALTELAKMHERTIAGLREAVRSALERVDQLEARRDFFTPLPVRSKAERRR